MRSLLSQLFRPRRPSARAPRTFRPACEALEDRLAPSSAVPLNHPTGQLLVSGASANDAIAIGRVNGPGTGYVSVSADGSGHPSPETYQVSPASLTLADRPAPVVSFTNIEAFRLDTAQDATVVDGRGSGYPIEHLQGAPAPSGATATPAPAPGVSDAMFSALTLSREPQAAGQAPATDLYWLALAREPLAGPGLA
jgi:hypothetical protein